MTSCCLCAKVVNNISQNFNMCDFFSKSWVYWQWIFATIKSTIDTVKCSNTIQLSPFECNTEHKNVFLHITGRKKSHILKFCEMLLTTLAHKQHDVIWRFPVKNVKIRCYLVLSLLILMQFVCIVGFDRILFYVKFSI
jgi:hypothetical protein